MAITKYAADSAEWERIKGAFLAATHTALMRDQSFQPWYAYLKPSALGVWGELLAVPEGTEAPEGFEIITAERIPPADRDAIRRWFERFAGKLPVFPLEVA